MFNIYYINNNADIGKFNHYTSVTDSKSEILVEFFFFKNNKQGFHGFYDKTKSYIFHRHIAGLKATDHYGDNFIAFLLIKQKILHSTIAITKYFSI